MATEKNRRPRPRFYLAGELASLQARLRIIEDGARVEVIRTDDCSDPYFCSYQARYTVRGIEKTATKKIDLRDDARLTKKVLKYSDPKRLCFLRQHINKLAELAARIKTLRRLERALKEATR